MTEKTFFVFERLLFCTLNLSHVRQVLLSVGVCRTPFLQDGVAGFDRIAVEEVLRVVDQAAELQGNPPVFLGFTHGLNRGSDRYLVAGVCTERRIAFIVHGCGQDDVHVVMGFITIEIVRCASEVHILNGFCINLRLRPNHDVKAEGNHTAKFAVLNVFRQLVRVELNLCMVPNRNEVFVQTVFLVGLEPVVVNEVFCQTVVVNDVAFRTDTEESASGDVNITQNCGNIQQSAGAVDTVSGMRQ